MTFDFKELDQFTGTAFWYKHQLFPRYTYTDGVKYLAEQTQAYWLMDAIISWQLEPTVRAEGFQQWILTVENDNSGKLVCSDGNNNHLAMQELGYTDFPSPGIELWLTNTVLQLPSEY